MPLSSLSVPTPPAQVCYVAPHLWRLGWVNFQHTLSPADFTVGQVVTRTIESPTSNYASDVHSLRILPFPDGAACFVLIVRVARDGR